jgi:HEAT repeat protein
VATVEIASLRVLPGTPGPKGEVKVEIALAPAEPGASPTRREAGVGTAPLLVGAATPQEGWRRALAEATQAAAEGLAIGARADGKTEDGLIADLSAKDDRVREHAVRVLGERRSRAAVPALTSRLRGEEPRIAMRIVGALAQIGDERAVPVLIELSRGTDAVATARLVRFIGDIGGSEAEGYLLTLEAGHGDPRVRTAAREALDELGARSREQASLHPSR